MSARKHLLALSYCQTALSFLGVERRDFQLEQLESLLKNSGLHLNHFNFSTQRTESREWVTLVAQLFISSRATMRIEALKLFFVTLIIPLLGALRLFAHCPPDHQ